jgi:hypothetical protein
MRFELERVRRLVQRKPHPELVAWEIQRLLDNTDVRFDVVEFAGRDRFAPEQCQVVLTQDTTSEVAEKQTELSADDGAVESAPHRRNHRPAAAGVGIERLDRREHDLERVEIGVDPVDPIEGIRTLDRVGQLGSGVGADDRDTAANQLTVVVVETRPLDRGQRGAAVHVDRDSAGLLPIDQVSRGIGRSRGAQPATRPGTNGGTGKESGGDQLTIDWEG